MKEVLLQRRYPENIIDRGIEKARKIRRTVALLKVRKKILQKRPIFAVKYDHIDHITIYTKSARKTLEGRAMVAQDKYLAEVFVEPPLTAYRRQNIFRDMLIKSKVWKNLHCLSICNGKEEHKDR